MKAYQAALIRMYDAPAPAGIRNTLGTSSRISPTEVSDVIDDRAYNGDWSNRSIAGMDSCSRPMSRSWRKV